MIHGIEIISNWVNIYLLEKGVQKMLVKVNYTCIKDTCVIRVPCIFKGTTESIQNQINKKNRVFGRQGFTVIERKSTVLDEARKCNKRRSVRNLSPP
jgi:hypothetical protein